MRTLLPAKVIISAISAGIVLLSLSVILVFPTAAYEAKMNEILAMALLLVVAMASTFVISGTWRNRKHALVAGSVVAAICIPVLFVVIYGKIQLLGSTSEITAEPGSQLYDRLRMEGGSELRERLFELRRDNTLAGLKWTVFLIIAIATQTIALTVMYKRNVLT